MSGAAAKAAEAEARLRLEEPPSGAVFWVLSALGSAIIAFGIYGVVHDASLTKPGNLIAFLLGGLLIHDLVIAPFVILVGLGLRRTVPGRFRGPLQAALALTGVLALLSVPVIGGYGYSKVNPTVVYSHHYARALLVLVALLLAGAALGMLRAVRRPAATSDPASGDGAA